MISQIPTAQQLIPPELGAKDETAPVYDYEPDEGEILAELLPRAVTVRIYRALAGKRGVVLRRADERDGQRDPQRRRNGEEIHACATTARARR